MYVCEFDRDSVCVLVCVCVRERERERRGESVCEYVSVYQSLTVSLKGAVCV